MRLINLGILFMSLFFGAIIYPFLQELYDRTAFFSMEQYNKNMDRAAEDAFYKQILEEYSDGSISLEEEEIQIAFAEQLCRDFDISIELEGAEVEEILLLQELINRKEDLSIQEQIQVAGELEALAEELSTIEEFQYNILFPLEEEASWHRKVDNHSFYAFMELDDGANYGWPQLFSEMALRYEFSGAKLVKNPEKYVE